MLMLNYSDWEFIFTIIYTRNVIFTLSFVVTIHIYYIAFIVLTLFVCVMFTDTNIQVSCYV